MNREEARQYIQGRAKDYLKPDGSGKGYVCPVCGSGSGNHGTGITTKDGVHFTCWRGCFTSADLIDIIGIEHGVEDYNGKLTAAAEAMGITIDGRGADKGSRSGSRNQNHSKSERYTQPALHNTQPSEDYTAFFLQASNAIGETDYHRGISLETLKRYKIGYTENYQGENKAAHGWKALIIPTSRSSYVIRNTDPAAAKENRYRKQGMVQIFNAGALDRLERPVFVVEGELDALSIIDAGEGAVALGSISNTRKLLEILKKKEQIPTLILCLDNDEAGTQALETLREGLAGIGAKYYEMQVAAPYKDANEYIMNDRTAFFDAVHEAAEVEAREREASLEEERKQLMKESAAYSLKSFIADIVSSKTAAFVPTGFKNVDKLLDGGLYAGLYFIGAVSSLGKTTFCLQVADQIAATGRDVLIFSLEMARNELIAKSVSRLTLLQDLKLNGDTKSAKTTRGILTGSRYAGYNQKEKQIIQSAITAYGEYARHIYITEGVGNVGVQEVRQKVEKHIRLTGNAPVVLIDYLQILAPADIRATDKQNTDKAVMELKRLSRDTGIPIIGISSFNRDSYTEPVSMTSFKESGAIEYSSDVLIGLQYEGMDYQEGESSTARDKRIRALLKENLEAARKGDTQKIQLKILKNRNGSKGDTKLEFYPLFNYFKDSGTDTQEGNNGWRKAESSYDR